MSRHITTWIIHLSIAYSLTFHRSAFLKAWPRMVVDVAEGKGGFESNRWGWGLMFGEVNFTSLIKRELLVDRSCDRVDALLQ